MKNKKAVSLLVSYAILIVVAVGISFLVYSALKLYLPSDKPTCSQDIQLIITKAECFTNSENKVIVELSNRGLFNISAVYIRLGEKDKTIRHQLNKEEEFLPKPLAPGETQIPWELRNIPFSLIAGQTYILEVQPAEVKNRRVVLCENAITTQEITCS